MNNSAKIADASDSLIDLLTAQCSDLEKLFSLAREENKAAELGLFGLVLNITSERSEISKRLETFHQQIAELRGFLGKSNEKTQKYNNVSDRVVELANMTLVKDQETRLLLTTSRDKSNEELRKIEFGNRGTNVYLREQKKGLAYVRDF